MIGFSDLVDLWVIKIKSPWSFAHHSRSRSSEQSTKRRSRSENMGKVCLFCSKNNQIADSWQKHFWRNSWGAQRFVGFFSWLCVSEADWLGEQPPITWKATCALGVDKKAVPLREVRPLVTRASHDCHFSEGKIRSWIGYLKGVVSATPLFCLHLGTRLTKLLEIHAKKYLIIKRNS